MTSVSQTQRQIRQLLTKHQNAIQSNRSSTEIWELFYDDPWFRSRLEKCAHYTASRFYLSRDYKDDIRQEALILFSRSIQRDVSLGYDSERGSYGAFVTTIIYRCCQKATRQFRRFSCPSATPELFTPTAERVSQHIFEFDLIDSIERISEPCRSTLLHRCRGLSIEEIAKLCNKSNRTIYRWLEQGIEQMRGAFLDETKTEDSLDNTQTDISCSQSASD